MNKLLEHSLITKFANIKLKDFASEAHTPVIGLDNAISYVLEYQYSLVSTECFLKRGLFYNMHF